MKIPDIKENRVILISTFAWCALLILLSFTLASKWRRDMERFYKDGFRVGRVVGRDDILLNLKRADCYKQPVNDLMNPDEKDLKPDSLQWIEQAREDLLRVKR